MHRSIGKQSEKFSQKKHRVLKHHVGVKQYITQHSLVSITERLQKRLQITSEDRAVPAFILVTPLASVTTAYCTTVP